MRFDRQSVLNEYDLRIWDRENHRQLLFQTGIVPVFFRDQQDWIVYLCRIDSVSIRIGNRIRFKVARIDPNRRICDFGIGIWDLGKILQNPVMLLEKLRP